jgi:ribonuclease-3
MIDTFLSAFNIDANDSRMYEFALMHRSYMHQKRKNKREDQQERLEFFGDAVLKFVVSYYLMHKFPKMEEGMLTKIRSRIISDRSLARLGLALGLDHHVLVSDSERAVNGQQRPALLADTFEAILGAMFLDKGIEYTQDWINNVIETHMAPYLDINFIVDYKTHLQELVHKKVFHFKVTVRVNNEDIEAFGEGENKKLAQQVAAKACVHIIKTKQAQ